MKPVYFPFTYISESVARQMARLFGATIVYLPMPAGYPETIRQLQADGCIDMRVPYPDDAEHLKQSCREFKAWGEQHYGDGASLKKAFSEGFYNHSFTSQIRSDILKYDHAVEAAPDLVFAARLFLLMAQELDAQQHDIDLELALSMAAERELFARMNGQERTPDSSGEQMKNADYGAVMTAARLSAWSYLFGKDAPKSCFLVTNSRASLFQMIESFPDIRQVAGFEGISCELSHSQQKELSQYLASLSQTSNPEGVQMTCPYLSLATHEDRINFSIYILPGMGLQAIAAKLSSTGDAIQFSDQSPASTVICLVE